MRCFLVSVKRTMSSMCACFRSFANKDFFRIWKYVGGKKRYITTSLTVAVGCKCLILKFVNHAGRAKTVPKLCRHMCVRDAS